MILKSEEIPKMGMKEVFKNVNVEVLMVKEKIEW